MIRSLRIAAPLSVAAITLATLCAPPAFAGHTPPPDAGVWSVTNEGFSGHEVVGQFKVARNHKSVTGFKIKLNSDMTTACGSGTVKVRGKLKLYEAKGQGEYGAYDQWVVGKNKPSADPVIQPEKITIIHSGKKQTARLYIAFVGRKGHDKEGNAGGELLYKHSACDIQFTVKKLGSAA